MLVASEKFGGHKWHNGQKLPLDLPVIQGLNIINGDI